MLSHFLTVTAVGSGSDNVVAALSTAALDGCTITVLAVVLASLLNLEDVVHVTAEDRSSSVILNARSGFSDWGCACESGRGEGEGGQEGGELPKMSCES